MLTQSYPLSLLMLAVVGCTAPVYLHAAVRNSAPMWMCGVPDSACRTVVPPTSRIPHAALAQSRRRHQVAAPVGATAGAQSPRAPYKLVSGLQICSCYLISWIVDL